MDRVIILLGPTGVGKTSASIIVAEKLCSEIIGSDSMQIYRDMDIGTAKPTREELARVRHHMIDIVEPSETYSAGRYVSDVRPILDSIIARGRIPVITGGTGLYIKAMTRGLFAGPSADWSVREELIEKEASDPGCLFRKLSELDPASAAKIEKNDTRRIIRALEVCLVSDKSMSAMQELHTEPLPYEFMKIGLTRDRSELYGLIDGRVDEMISSGLEQEVRRILTLGPSITPLQAIGYREFCAFFRGETDLVETIRLIKRNTRRYAKRQYTWFRKEEDVSWLDVTGLFDPEKIAAMVLNALNNRQK